MAQRFDNVKLEKGMYHEAGIGFVGFEKDKHMYDLSMERYRAETAQMSLSDLMKGWR